ncbi:amidohydrolase family protein [Halobacillus salinarum]|uniref:amidohydrolase family protein n=1 Tax=Halobacillus salinarum TaxID=2932257 RepID=UPI002961F62C|nr:amidohydrolase family protein [Halobacillus salinarum]
MHEIAKTGKVLALHSENGPIIQYLTEQLRNKPEVTAEDYTATRPIKAEVEAVERAIHYAELTGCPLHFVHISSQAAVEKIGCAKRAGLDLTVETCSHYLLFNELDLADKGAIAKCAPPLRSEEEQQRLIQLLQSDQFDMISSDHSPCPPLLKSTGLMDAWGGITGGQFTFLSMMELALRYDIAFEKIAALLSANPARRFKLSGKGKLERGADADLTVINLKQSFTVTEKNHYAKHKPTLFMDHTFPCRIDATFSRGQLVYYADAASTSPPQGRWLTS